MTTQHRSAQLVENSSDLSEAMRSYCDEHAYNVLLLLDDPTRLGLAIGWAYERRSLRPSLDAAEVLALAVDEQSSRTTGYVIEARAVTHKNLDQAATNVEEAIDSARRFMLLANALVNMLDDLDLGPGAPTL